ncbi:unnamed protein product [Miscanthus lutarioriparius]|uniref:histidine kinase n=1 Tax=Miscanthus lutarioriparius TaxID=422564 RepID=A0A811SM24_9POAL|nr:unnamed protein product [Miscanthus lutarioriparius]
MVMTIAKVSTAVVSCATALMLVHIIPDLLSVKTRELFLKNKAEELDREMGLIRTQEETGRHVRMLTHEIRSTLDRHTILKTTLVELGRTLGLEECALWMPSRSGSSLQLSHTAPPDYCRIIGRYVPPEVAAVRVPLLHLSNFQINDWPELSAKSFAIMVLMLPSDSARKWHVHELELVEVVADQVAVALSHAAILEESMRARDLLMEQNVALDLAQERLRWLSVLLTPEQRLMVETVLKSSNLLATLINDVLDLSKLEDGSLELEIKAFNLHAVFKEVMSFIKPIASIKRLSVSVMLAPDLPLCAIGDEKRLMQTILNISGNAVKFTKEGHITLVASIVKADSLREFRTPEFHPTASDDHFYLKVQVKDTGCGIGPQDVPHVFTKFAHPGGNRGLNGSGLGLAICKRFVSLMGGHIWIDSEGTGRGCTATFVVKLGVCDNTNTYQQQVTPLVWPSSADSDLSAPSAPKVLPDGRGSTSLKSRYQRSV